MPDWYASSAAYSAITAFVPSAVYSVGDIRKPTAPALKAQWAFRCTTAGTASTEPTWPTANNATITTGGATFTNVTGQSTYGWSAAAGDIPTLIGGVGAIRFVAGDRMFVSSDHSETQSAVTWYGSGQSGAASYAVGQYLSVNRAGSVPPVAADLLPGATVSNSATSTVVIETFFPTYHYGITYIYTGNSTGISCGFGTTAYKSIYFDTCQLYLNTATSGMWITNGAMCSVTLNNTTVRFGNTAQGVRSSGGGTTPLEFVWLNTPNAIAGATIPSTMFGAGSHMLATVRGVDLSAVTATLVGLSNAGNKYLFDSCRIASGVIRYDTSAPTNTRDLVELINCFNGTNIINESYQPAGAVTTEFTIVLAGGAQDNVGLFSHKMVSSANVDKYVQPLAGFWMDVNYTTTGSAKTATVELISSATLNNDEISLELEYLGTASSSLASFANSLPVTVLTAASAVTTSTATWNSSPATPQKQKLQVTFTPRTAGRVRARVRLGKASTTVYVDPQVTIT